MGCTFDDDPDKPEVCHSPWCADRDTIRTTDTELGRYGAPCLEDAGSIEIDRLQDLMPRDAIAINTGGCILHGHIEAACCGVVAGINCGTVDRCGSNGE